jgi:hypothetical protein
MAISHFLKYTGLPSVHLSAWYILSFHFLYLVNCGPAFSLRTPWFLRRPFPWGLFLVIIWLTFASFDRWKQQFVLLTTIVFVAGNVSPKIVCNNLRCFGTTSIMSCYILPAEGTKNHIIRCYALAWNCSLISQQGVKPEAVQNVNFSLF